MLVVQPQTAQFPMFCIRTNTPVPALTPLDLPYLEEQNKMTDRHAVRADVFTLFMFIYEWAYTKRAKFDAPLDEGWWRGFRFRRMIGRWLVYAGILAPICGIVAMLLVDDRGNPDLPRYFGYSSLAGFCLIPIGVIFVAVFARGIKVEHSYNGCFWLSGVSKDYLQRLPEVPNK
jgi:hypothetical protein